MPQEHQVLKCFSCETFQVHIVKKVKKWECKICGAKQSVKRNFGRGSGKDCRNQVMKLNEFRLTKGLNLNETEFDRFEDNNDLQQPFNDDLHIQRLKDELKQEKPFTSKWADYLDEPTTDQVASSENTFDFFTEENEKKRVKKMPDYPDLNKKVCIESNDRESSLIHKEANSFISALRNAQNFENTKATSKERSDQSKIKIGLQSSKYTKFLDKPEEENKNNKIKLNIFDSDLTDLDNILSFN